jgi:hypothetical protein
MMKGFPQIPQYCPDMKQSINLREIILILKMISVHCYCMIIFICTMVDSI